MFNGLGQTIFLRGNKGLSAVKSMGMKKDM